MHRLTAAAVVFALLAGPARAQRQWRKPQPPPAGTSEQAAAQVLAAWKANDESVLELLATRANPDPWLVADALCARGEYDAAEAFARTPPLATFVARQRETPTGTAARAALAKANAALPRRDGAAALAALRDTSLGPDVVSVRVVHARGLALRLAGDLEGATRTLSEAADAASRLGWTHRAAVVLNTAGLSAFNRTAWSEAFRLWERGLALSERHGHRRQMALALTNLGSVHQRLSALEEARACHERAFRVAAASNDKDAMAHAAGNLGVVLASLGALGEAVRWYEFAYGLMEKLGGRRELAWMLRNIGDIFVDRGPLAKALPLYERALAIHEELGDRADAVLTLANLGVLYRRLGRNREALATYERALRLHESAGNRESLAWVLSGMGSCLLDLGSYRAALACLERALELKEQLRDRLGTVTVLNKIGDVHFGRGSYAEALASHERALDLAVDLGDGGREATTLVRIGKLRAKLGSLAGGAAALERAARIQASIGQHSTLLTTLVVLGEVQRAAGARAEALVTLQQALALAEKLGTRAQIASALNSLGTLHRFNDEHAQALAHYERALALCEETGNNSGTLTTLLNVARAHGMLGRHEKAFLLTQRAVRLASETGERGAAAKGLRLLADMHLYAGRPADALRAAREGVAKLARLAGRLGEEQGAHVRSGSARLFECGVRAGLELGSAEDVCFFLESGRAGGLLEALGGREALREATVPAKLAQAEADARADVLEAEAELARAAQQGKRDRMRRARKRVEGAHGRMLEVVSAIQRAAKARANVAYPDPVSLAALQSALAERDALVCFGLFQQVAVALVVRHDTARVVRLNREALNDAAFVPDPGSDAREQLAALKAVAIAPLDLGDDVTRVLVSPDGALSYAPFGALFGGRDVVCVPSGTTCEVLQAEGRARGEGVLALGDADYGGRLVALPATRVEAGAVGDVVLLGADATARGLAAALSRRPRWRAVHLACHGRVDPARPLLSSLALTGGNLLTLDVFRMRVPADLVVLSACETARGKVYAAEGVVGFTRAFMFAGAPRVIVSLWKVDDDATQALMVKFYEYWKEHPTATALKRAQEHVASQEKWKHPYYWAAWQLWGLGD